MANVELYDYQIEAVEKMHNGCILAGGVGTGKSRTSLAYIYTKELKGTLKINGKGKWTQPKVTKDIYIITTAQKRDTHEWETELGPFGLSTDPDISVNGIKVIIDSWNNIKKYTKVYGAIFIFDEDRVTGSGTWVKAFWKICKKNRWIILSATSGDNWKDYEAVFIANGFYKNRRELETKHFIFAPWSKFPKIMDYRNERLLRQHRRDILVPMKTPFKNQKDYKMVNCAYDKVKYRTVWFKRWDIYNNCPIEETGKLCYLIRRVVNEDPDRIQKLTDILKEHPKSIIFYNYTPELGILRHVAKELEMDVGEWNGEVHAPVPTGKRWVYLVQYTAGAMGWNCITTDTIIFYSLNYSYKTMVQAAGRIDRLNTPFKTLHYIYLKSVAPIDLAIMRALKQKKKFNETDFVKGGGK